MAGLGEKYLDVSFPNGWRDRRESAQLRTTPRPVVIPRGYLAGGGIGWRLYYRDTGIWAQRHRAIPWGREAEIPNRIHFWGVSRDNRDR